MILIVTYKEDFTADFLINKLNAQRRKYLRLNTDNIDDHFYKSSIDSKYSFQLNSINFFDGIWYRRIKTPQLNENFSVHESAYLLGEYKALFQNLFSGLESRNWMSKPLAITKAEDKTLQLRESQKLKFKIPETIISNDKDVIREFAKTHVENGLVIKPLYSGKYQTANGSSLIYTSKLKSEDLRSIDNFRITPCIIQQLIPKLYEIRVTVVNNKIFAASVDSQSNPNTQIDWRKEKLPFTAYNLPNSIATKCIELVSNLNLNFGAIDLIRGCDGEYYFLEINPNGQWAWIEMDTGLPISQAIIDFLYES